jgi:transcription antitermination factor NusG
MVQELEWKLVYTKARCEAWSEAHLRNQGFAVLLPRVRNAKGTAFEPLFPRYVFIGHTPGRDIGPIRNTRGVQRIVEFAAHPARVPAEVIEEIRSRMDAHGVVALDANAPSPRPLFDRRAQERLRALVRLAQAGFRVVAA